MPVGPHILWPEKARKSQPMARTSSGMWPADWAASITVTAPTARARRQSSAAGLIVPRVLEMWVKAKSFTSGVSSVSSCARSSPPSALRRRSAGSAAWRRCGGEQLPRHEVGMVLHLGGEDDIAGLEMGVAPAAGDEVDALGGAAGEDDLGGIGGVDEFRDAGAGALVGVGRAHGERVEAAMDVAVVALVVAHSASMTARGFCDVAALSR